MAFSSLGAAGNAFLDRYRAEGDRSDLDAAIEAFREGIRAGSQPVSGYETMLATALTERHKADDKIADLTEAITLFERAAAAPPDANLPTRLNNLANGLLSRDRLHPSQADLERAIEAARAATSIPPVSALRICTLAAALTRRFERGRSWADIDEAIEMLEQLRLHVPKSEPAWQNVMATLADAWMSRFDASGQLSDLERSIDGLQELISTLSPGATTRAGRCHDLSRALELRWRLTAASSDLDAARTAAEEAVSLSAGTHEHALYLGHLGVVMRRLYHVKTQRNELGAERYLEEAIRLFRKAVDCSAGLGWRGSFFLNLGTGLEDRYDVAHDENDLVAALENYNTAVQNAQSDPGLLAFAEHNVGFASMKLFLLRREAGVAAAAVDAFTRALALTSPAAPDRASQLDHLGRAHLLAYSADEDPRSLDAAITTGEESWSLFERGFANPVAYQIGLQEVSGMLTTWLVSAYVHRAAQAPDTSSADLRRAFELAEANKARVLTAIVGREPLPDPPGCPAELAARERELSAQLGAYDARAVAARDGIADVRSPVQTLEYFTNRQKSRQELERVWREIERCGPEAVEYVSLRRGDAPSWDGLRAFADELGSTAALVSLFCGLKATYLFVLRAGWTAPRIVEAPIDPDAWTEILVRLYNHVYVEPGETLKEDTWTPLLLPLLEPARVHLRDLSRVVFAPERQGYVVPWSVAARAAEWRDASSAPLPIVTMPALGVAMRLRKRPKSGPGPALVVGNPTCDLPYSEIEARQVADMLNARPLIGAEASKAAVLAALPHAALAHFSAHAEFDRHSPLDSLILLADGGLKAREIVTCQTPSSDLLVLTGCETGISGSIGGDEFAGLAQAFFYAACRSLVVSLWRIDDAATAAVMEAFYREWRSGVDKAIALARAQSAVRESTTWRHPFFWGAFVLMGDWD